MLLGAGKRLTPALATEPQLTLERERARAGGSVEIVYRIVSVHGPEWGATRSHLRPDVRVGRMPRGKGRENDIAACGCGGMRLRVEGG